MSDIAEQAEVTVGDVVQITSERPGLVGAFLLVDEVKPWGVQGFIHHVKEFEESTRIYLRLEYGRYLRIGQAILVPADVAEEMS